MFDVVHGTVDTGGADHVINIPEIVSLTSYSRDSMMLLFFSSLKRGKSIVPRPIIGNRLSNRLIATNFATA